MVEGGTRDTFPDNHFARKTAVVAAARTVHPTGVNQIILQNDNHRANHKPQTPVALTSSLW